MNNGNLEIGDKLSIVQDSIPSIEVIDAVTPRLAISKKGIKFKRRILALFNGSVAADTNDRSNPVRYTLIQK